MSVLPKCLSECLDKEIKVGVRIFCDQSFESTIRIKFEEHILEDLWGFCRTL